MHISRIFFCYDYMLSVEIMVSLVKTVEGVGFISV